MKNPMIATRLLLDLINDGSVECSAEAKDALVTKARHMLRDEEGKFRRINDHVDNVPDDSGPLPMRHSGACAPAVAVAAHGHARAASSLVTQNPDLASIGDCVDVDP